MTLSEDARSFIKYWEKLKLQAYPDPGTGSAPWTIGWGHTGPEVTHESVISKKEAEMFFLNDVHIVESAIDRLVTVPLSQGQMDALGSFVFNLGEGALQKSTLLKLLNSGDYEGAAAQLPRWKYSNGILLVGLVRRRKAERALWDGEHWKAAIKKGVG